MKGNLQQGLIQVKDPAVKQALQLIGGALIDRLSTQTVVSGALAINAASSPIVKIGAALYAWANGILLTIAANTQMPALVGTVTNGQYGAWAFYTDSAGNLTTTFSQSVAALNLVRFLDAPVGKAMIGFVIVHPTGTGNFVGGTTNLDDVTVVPNAVYVNTLGPVDPTALLGNI